MEKEKFKIIGKITPRKDGIAKVTGQERYCIDVQLPRMLHARTVASPYAHARVVSVDTSAAEAMGAICITFADIPKVRFNERIITVPWALHKDRYVLADKVRKMGEAVAAVAAETEELAEKAARAVKVEYEVLPVVLDPVKAMNPDSPQLYETVMYGENEIKVENNIACTRAVEEGDVDKAFAEADIIMEKSYKTNKNYHAQMEPKSVVVQPEADGGITVWPTCQSIHNTRIVLGQIFGIPLSKINVKKVPIGGTFGSSIQMNTVVPICTALALKARRPVKLTLPREEDMHDHTNYPIQLDIKISAKNDGTLTGVKMNVVADIGAHITQGYSYLGVCIGWLVSMYKFPNIRYSGVAVYTNKAISCAMQGYGNPQINFVAETLMDDLAEKLDMDPIELRLKNYVGLGDTFWGQGPLVRSIVQSDGVPEMLERGAEMIGWKNRLAVNSQTGRFCKGIGLGRGFHTSSAGAPQPGDVIDFSGAFVKVNQDGSVDVVSALMDHGGGSLEAMAKLVAEELCVPLEKVNLAQGETMSTVYDVCTHATRGIYGGGGAAVKVAKQVKKEILETASHYMNIRPEGLQLKLDEEMGQCVIYCAAIPEKVMTLGQLATKCWAESWKTIASVDSYRPTNCPPAYLSCFVEVEVDTWTGIVTPKKTVIGSDCGTVINPDMAVGQMEGGLSRGMGFALLEDNVWDEEGQILSKGYWVDAKTPSIVESPRLSEIETFFTHTYEPTGPFGAKGLGEAAMNPIASAFANAIYNATGLRFRELPITPEKILMGLKGDLEGSGAEMTTKEQIL